MRNREYLTGVFRSGDLVYATNSVALVEVDCNEIKIGDDYYKWRKFDMDKCAEQSKAMRYVDLNDESIYSQDETVMEKFADWKLDYFSRFFEIALKDSSFANYDAGQIKLLCDVFKSLDVSIGFAYDQATHMMNFVGENRNYSVRALIYPRR